MGDPHYKNMNMVDLCCCVLSVNKSFICERQQVIKQLINFKQFLNSIYFD